MIRLDIDLQQRFDIRILDWADGLHGNVIRVWDTNGYCVFAQQFEMDCNGVSLRFHAPSHSRTLTHITIHVDRHTVLHKLYKSIFLTPSDSFQLTVGPSDLAVEDWQGTCWSQHGWSEDEY